MSDLDEAVEVLGVVAAGDTLYGAGTVLRPGHAAALLGALERRNPRPAPTGPVERCPVDCDGTCGLHDEWIGASGC